MKINARRSTMQIDGRGTRKVVFASGNAWQYGSPLGAIECPTLAVQVVPKVTTATVPFFATRA